MQKHKRINIIGAGFSGMVQAFYLAEAGYPVRLIEKSSRWGGLLGSKYSQGFLFEQAANAFLANHELQRVAEKIGVRLVKKKPEARRRFILRDGKMRRWPLSLSESLPLVPFVLGKKWKSSKHGPKEHETLQEWGHRILGVNQTRYLLEPAMQGVYASTLPALDASLILGSLAQKKKRGRLRGSVSPEKGMQEWNQKMMQYLLTQQVEVALSDEWNDFEFNHPTIFAMDLGSLRSLANQQKIPVDKSILETQSASLTSVTLAFKDPKQRLQEGFGCLFPESEGMNALGVLFNHSIFPGRADNGSSETWILNDQKIEFSQMSPSALLRYVLSDRAMLKKGSADPDAVFINQWPQRIPLYDQKLRAFLEAQGKEQWPYLLIGNYLGDLGLSKILFHAKHNLEKIQGGYFA